ncbi:MAG: hypothetical protein ACO307_02800 [Ilumatobacteraceae bacterium]
MNSKLIGRGGDVVVLLVLVLLVLLVLVVLVLVVLVLVVLDVDGCTRSSAPVDGASAHATSVTIAVMTDAVVLIASH